MVKPAKKKQQPYKDEFIVMEQIAVSSDGLYGIDSSGQVWVFEVERVRGGLEKPRKGWMALPMGEL